MEEKNNIPLVEMEEESDEEEVMVNMPNEEVKCEDFRAVLHQTRERRRNSEEQDESDDGEDYSQILDDIKNNLKMVPK